ARRRSSRCCCRKDNRDPDALRQRERSSPNVAEILSQSPLVESRVRPAPHCDLAVTEWLLRQPLNHVVSVARFIRERLELAGGIAATANIDEREYITV